MNNLERFITAQESSYETAFNEIKNGRKESHWMWYIFPQIIGLGESSTSLYYSIKSIEEAQDYVNDPYLYQNLFEITKVLLELEENNPYIIFGTIDGMKLKSSMTLFYEITQDEIFYEVLRKYYNGEKCITTLNILNNLKQRVLNKKQG